MKTKSKNETSKLNKMINAKVEELVAQGMTEQAAFSAVMQYLKTKRPAVFNFFCLMHSKGIR
jgi:hypothetical protein